MVKTSKFLSLVLRHQPQEIGITLDGAGWVSVSDLLSACESHGFPISPETLDEVVATNDKQRFSFSEDRTRIRANQGHSTGIDLGLEPLIPPAVLYHGTASRFLASIEKSGLEKRSRDHVHLSKDPATATKVGARHGKPVVLEIDSGLMQGNGHKFYLSDNGVWLTDHVPPEYIKSFSRSPGVTLLET